MTETPHELLAQGSLRREWPFLLGMAVLLAVLLHANAPEVWFWFAALLVLLLWRWLAWASRRQARLEARVALSEAATATVTAGTPTAATPTAATPTAATSTAATSTAAATITAAAQEPVPLAPAPTADAGSSRSGSSGEPPG